MNNVVTVIRKPRADHHSTRRDHDNNKLAALLSAVPAPAASHPALASTLRQGNRVVHDTVGYSALSATALAQPVDEPSDHERGRQERDDHADAGEHIGENKCRCRWS